MKLQMIGCSHHDAAVEFREKISFTSDQVGQALKRFSSTFSIIRNRIDQYMQSR